jgi:hypothetical protein
MTFCNGRFDLTTLLLLLLVTIFTLLPSVTSFCGSGANAKIPTTVRRSQQPQQHQPFSLSSSAFAGSSDADFSTFADSLDVEDDRVAGTVTSTTTTTKSQNNNNGRSTTRMVDKDKPWQAKLEELFDPMTSGAQRQILLSELLNANEKIRESVLDALTNRKVRENNNQKDSLTKNFNWLHIPIIHILRLPKTNMFPQLLFWSFLTLVWVPSSLFLYLSLSLSLISDRSTFDTNPA